MAWRAALIIMLLLQACSRLNSSATPSEQFASSHPRIEIEFMYNPFCVPSDAALQQAILPLRGLIENNPQINFKLVPAILNYSPEELSTLAELACQAEQKGAYTALIEVRAELEKESKWPEGSAPYDRTWDKKRAIKDRCANLDPYRKYVQESFKENEKRDLLGSPRTVVNGEEIDGSDIEIVRTKITELLSQR